MSHETLMSYYEETLVQVDDLQRRLQSSREQGSVLETSLLQKQAYMKQLLSRIIALHRTPSDPMKIDLYHTLLGYHQFTRTYNADKPLKKQLRSDIYTGQLLLKLLCDTYDPRRGLVLDTNLYGISSQKNQSLKTITRHLEKLRKAGLITRWESKKTGKKESECHVFFEPKFVRFYKGRNVDNLPNSVDKPVDNSNHPPDPELHSKNSQLIDNQILENRQNQDYGQNVQHFNI